MDGIVGELLSKSLLNGVLRDSQSLRRGVSNSDGGALIKRTLFMPGE